MAVESRGDLASRHGSIGRFAAAHSWSYRSDNPICTRTYVRKCSAHRLRELARPRRRTALVCFRRQSYRDAVDQAVDMFDKLLTRTVAHAERELDQHLREQRRTIRSADYRHIEALIDKGGSVAPDYEAEKGTRLQLVQLRLPRSLVQRIDKARQHRIVAPSRHAWLLEALLKKLETEEHPKVS